MWGALQRPRYIMRFLQLELQLSLVWGSTSNVKGTSLYEPNLAFTHFHGSSMRIRRAESEIPYALDRLEEMESQGGKRASSTSNGNLSHWEVA
jgi:hypothetical protein